MTAPAERLSAAIESTGVAKMKEVVATEEGPYANRMVTMKFRVNDPPGTSKGTGRAIWLPTATFILNEQKNQKEGEGWAVHLCQQYLTDDNDRLVYVWNINWMAVGEDVESAVSDFCRVVSIISHSLKQTVNVNVQRVNTTKQGNGNTATPKPQPSGRMAGPVVRGKSVPGSKIAPVFMSGPIEVVIPLVGVNPKRNKPDGAVGAHGKKGKGAHLIGSRGDQYS